MALVQLPVLKNVMYLIVSKWLQFASFLGMQSVEFALSLLTCILCILDIPMRKWIQISVRNTLFRTA
jgi:uncharacterized membrane protein